MDLRGIIISISVYIDFLKQAKLINNDRNQNIGCLGGGGE